MAPLFTNQGGWDSRNRVPYVPWLPCAQVSAFEMTKCIPSEFEVQRHCGTMKYREKGRPRAVSNRASRLFQMPVRQHDNPTALEKPQASLEVSAKMDHPDNQTEGSVKKQNKQVSDWLPDHNTPYCESVSDFLFRYRKNTIEAALGIPALALLPKATCCSDTEDDGNGGYVSIDLGWRSSKYKEFLHMIDEVSRQHGRNRGSGRMVARRLDSKRTFSGRINRKARACDGLPESCYSERHLSQLSMTGKYLWDKTNRIPTHLLDHYLLELQNLLKKRAYI
ncbi:uncharacterized protein MELLADRAFT_108216 [Melampsora larici-populina 98AG31]|uniref:Uncharacterized protein n=1 Tax=Melampsora larici-populina (strain 98AG31 / pathotype 3-4-7) TaxID=747676 RepID=F4RSC7_MELLP|nr:uncharacterized protein MELLADRAFT_108216 [Melampsora larici-populina 98AG31]EGG04575.1 hypothetical protein MELLADRAFT_108216 [Melampsora larici-populina 98AG31]